MEAKTKAVIDKLIRVMEEHEQSALENMQQKKTRIPKDRFMAGWAGNIHLEW